MTPHRRGRVLPPAVFATLAAMLVVGFSDEASAEPPSSGHEEDPPKNPELEMGDKHDEAQKELAPGASSPARPEVDAASEPPKREDPDDPIKKFTVSGYLETFYQWNFNAPANGISNYRGYDTRHNTLSIQNAVVDVGFRAKDLLARIALQAGLAPATMYQDEPRAGGSDGAAGSSGELWRHLQRASLGWQATKVVLLEAGVFPSATGVESLAVKENWNWSRSTASTRLPNYQAGIRATFNVSPYVDVFSAILNGWNNILDNNDEKSGIVGMHYKVANKLTFSGSYFGGVERDGGAKEGRAWRHGFETWTQWDVTDHIQLAADGSAGFERTRFGVAWWASAAAYARAKVTEWLYAAARADRTWEDAASNARGTSDPMLIPAKYVTSFTGTVDLRPVKGFSTRLEYRHDAGSSPLYFRGKVEGNGSEATPYVPNARHQNTALLGLVAWF